MSDIDENPRDFEAEQRISNGLFDTSVPDEFHSRWDFEELLNEIFECHRQNPSQ